MSVPVPSLESLGEKDKKGEVHKLKVWGNVVLPIDFVGPSETEEKSEVSISRCPSLEALGQRQERQERQEVLKMQCW